MTGVFYIFAPKLVHEREKMACILHIETSTKVCSVAVSQDSAVIFDKADFEGPNHAQVCGPFVEEALSFAESHAIPLDAVAVSEGPGSYTGLRIGVSMAKGVAYGRGVPLIAVPTLKLIAVPLLLFREDLPDEALFVPMIDARRMEVYTAAYTPALNAVLEPQAMILDEHSFETLLEQGYQLVLMGNGSDKARQVLSRDGVRFIEGIKPVAVDMLALAEKAYREKNFIDVAYSTPLYLKEFQATKPKNALNL